MKCKKLLAAVLTAALCAGASMTAFAAGTDNAAAPVTQQGASNVNYDGSIEGHTFVAYQIFSGEYSDGVLSNIKWGDGVNGEALAEALGVSSATEAAEKLSEYSSYSSEAYEAAAIVYENIIESNAITADASGKLMADAGYYLVVDNGPAAEGSQEGYAYNLALLQVNDGQNAITPTVKNSVPTAEKKVEDKNDSEGNVSDWQDSADYDIGDSVPFQITGVVASNYADYTAYSFVFHDEEEAGLTFADDVRVYLDSTDNEITSGYEVVAAPADGDTFDVVFENLKDIQGVTAGSRIIIQYSATLNENANIGAEGNINTMHLEYSNNPNGEGTGNTPKDTVIVFTYKTDINKVTGDEANPHALSGAGFTLFKKYAEAPAGLELLTESTFADNENIDVSEYINQGYYMVKSIKADENTSTFEFKGLDDGEYLLVESETPAGYNSIQPVEFTVTATHVESFDFAEGERTSYLTALTGNRVSGDIDINSKQEINSEETVTNYIFNNAGSTLPSTGGIGTTIFYVVGGLLIIAAVVLLISKKRMEKED
jgi:fimbrial isopeptide formation D2 family protein/LPXTG-motif cell wall-anchored protein